MLNKSSLPPQMRAERALRNPRLELTCRVRSSLRAFSPDGNGSEGWTIVLELEPGTLLKLFVPGDVLEMERIVGDAFDPVTNLRRPHTLTIRQKPALKPGDEVTLE